MSLCRIAFAGPSGSGKTSLRKMMVEELGEHGVKFQKVTPESPSRYIHDKWSNHTWITDADDVTGILRLHNMIIDTKLLSDKGRFNLITDRTFMDTYLYCKLRIDEAIKDIKYNYEDAYEYYFKNELRSMEEKCFDLDWKNYDKIIITEPIPSNILMSDEHRTDKYFSEVFQQGYFNDICKLLNRLNVTIIPHCDGDLKARYEYLTDIVYDINNGD